MIILNWLMTLELSAVTSSISNGFSKMFFRATYMGKQVLAKVRVIS